MIRQTVRSVALAAAGLLLAGGAWGQSTPELVLRQVSSPEALIAEEYFGGEARRVQVSDMDLDRTSANTIERPFVGINVIDANTAGGNTVTGVTGGNEAEVTFMLTGATFSQSASPANIDQRTGTCRGAVGDDIETTVVAGGEPGDEAVTYRVEVTDVGGSTNSLEQGQVICFWVPDLNVTLATRLDGSRGVDVKAATIKPLTSRKTSTSDAFPASIAGPAAGDTAQGGVGSARNTDVRVLTAAKALTASLGTGSTALVSVADRKVIAKGHIPDPSAASAATAAKSLSIGTLSVDVSQRDIFKLNGSGLLDKEAVDSSLSGMIEVTVGGPYQSGDKLIVGRGATALSGTMDDGMKMAKVKVQTEHGITLPIAYVPGGVDDLTPSSFTAMAAYLFNDRRNDSAMISWFSTTSKNVPASRVGWLGKDSDLQATRTRLNSSTGYIRYEGVNLEGYAYGVVRGGGSDTSFVRVTCEAPADCQVFLDCTSQDGADYFSDAPPVPEGQTVVWSSDAIADVLGGGDNWTAGRGRCDLHSTGELRVQHMVRSGTTLVNSSAVVGRGLDESMKPVIDQTLAIVDNICQSVQGHLGRVADLDGADNDLSTPEDAVRAIDATPCRTWQAEAVANNVDTNGVNIDLTDPDNPVITNPNGF